MIPSSRSMIKVLTKYIWFSFTTSGQKLLLKYLLVKADVGILKKLIPRDINIYSSFNLCLPYKHAHRLKWMPTNDTAILNSKLCFQVIKNKQLSVYIKTDLLFSTCISSINEPIPFKIF